MPTYTANQSDSRVVNPPLSRPTSPSAPPSPRRGASSTASPRPFFSFFFRDNANLALSFRRLGPNLRNLNHAGASLSAVRLPRQHLPVDHGGGYLPPSCPAAAVQGSHWEYRLLRDGYACLLQVVSDSCRVVTDAGCVFSFSLQLRITQVIRLIRGPWRPSRLMASPTMTTKPGV